MFSLTSIVLLSSFAYLEPSRNNLILIVGISFVGYLAAFLYVDEYLREKQKKNI
jgi:general stress protein CsbA